jgi:hypothetical protein
LEEDGGGSGQMGEVGDAVFVGQVVEEFVGHPKG